MSNTAADAIADFSNPSPIVFREQPGKYGIFITYTNYGIFNG
jgi:hypothetical protein